jgi:RNAse (barnase) inhibitor barstar
VTGKYDNLIRSGRAGVYAAPRLINPLRAAAKRAGVPWYDLDLAGVSDRAAFLRRAGEALTLPDYFGGNWDALHECLLDLAGGTVTGAIIHWHRGAALARRSTEALATALEIFQEAAMYGGSGGRVFLVVVERESARGVDLPPLR